MRVCWTCAFIGLTAVAAACVPNSQRRTGKVSAELGQNEQVDSADSSTEKKVTDLQAIKIHNDAVIEILDFHESGMRLGPKLKLKHFGSAADYEAAKTQIAQVKQKMRRTSKFFSFAFSRKGNSSDVLSGLESLLEKNGKEKLIVILANDYKNASRSEQEVIDIYSFLYGKLSIANRAERIKYLFERDELSFKDTVKEDKSDFLAELRPGLDSIAGLKKTMREPYRSAIESIAADYLHFDESMDIKFEEDVAKSQ
jgi:hypothetical protein